MTNTWSASSGSVTADVSCRPCRPAAAVQPVLPASTEGAGRGGRHRPVELSGHGDKRMLVVDCATVHRREQNIQHEVVQADEVLDIDEFQARTGEMGKDLRFVEEEVEGRGRAS